MNLLVTTQVVNKNDANLGFFHEWLKRLAAEVDKLYVVCLFKGDYDLPSNVEVISLGKEQGKVNKLIYSFRFYKIFWQLRGKYDGVFVHMNPEYAVLAGCLWKLAKKKVLLWYTHKSVDFKLRLAEKLVDKIFTASKESFRLPSKKVEVVGHGIDTEHFRPGQRLLPSNYFLSVGRLSQSKDWETVVKALKAINDNGIIINPLLDIAGVPVTGADFEYVKELHKTFGNITFKSFTYDEMPQRYQLHSLLIHTSRTGSMDKVVLEALASGRPVVTSSEAYASLADGELKGVVFRFTPGNYKELAKTIEKIYTDGILNTIPNQKGIDYVRQHHNLDNLIQKIVGYFKA